VKEMNPQNPQAVMRNSMMTPAAQTSKLFKKTISK
jgi:hypothetical protein